MIALSAGMVWLAHSGRLTPARLLRVSLAYEIAVSLGISITTTSSRSSRRVPLFVASRGSASGS